MTETSSIWSDLKGYAATAWAWLDKPAEWFGAAVAWWPKLSLLVAIGLAFKALV